MSSLFSKTGQMAKKNLPVALNSLFKISRRQVHFQDALFGLENERNLLRMMKDEKSGGPSMIMNALKYQIETPFITDPHTIQGNDDTSRVFGLNEITKSPFYYRDFPEGVHKTVQDRNGLFEVSLQYDNPEKQWDPDRMLRLIAKTGLSDVLNSPTDRLFNGFLKKRGATRDDINRMYTAIYIKNAPSDAEARNEEFEKNFVGGNPEMGIRPELLDTLVNIADKADENTLSFTDVEFALFFLKYEAKDRYNMACLLNGGHLINPETNATLLNEMLKLLVKGDEEAYKLKHQEFMKATKGDTSTPSRSDKIINSFIQLPLFDLIFQQNSDFMARNFEALCVKIDAYLLNLVKPGEKLVVNLQFPFVFDGAPIFYTLLVSVDKDDLVKVEVLFTDADDPLSLTAKTVDPRLANSIKYCGTPSANICILENPDEVQPKFTEASKSLAALNKGETSDSQIFINRINCLYAAFSHPEVKLRFLNGQPLKICSQTKQWNDVCRAADGIGFMTSKFRMKDNPPDKEMVEQYFYTMDEAIDESYERGIPSAVVNYDWQPIQTFELSEKFKIAKAKTLNELPSGFPEPIAYPEHIGAAASLNPLNETGQLMTEEVFKKLTQTD